MKHLILLLLLLFSSTAKAQVQQDTIVKRSHDTILCYITNVSPSFIYYVTEAGSTDTIMLAKFVKSKSYGTVDNIIYCSGCERFHLNFEAADQSKPSESKPAETALAESNPGTQSSACPSVQCSGHTQEGHRCKRITTNCSGRCYQH